MPCLPCYAEYTIFKNPVSIHWYPKQTFGSLPGAFWTVVDLSANNERKNNCTSKHQAPSEVWFETTKSDAHDVSEHNTLMFTSALWKYEYLASCDLPNAVHICHIITSAPRIGAGAHSALYTGTVDDLGPIPRPFKVNMLQ